VPVIELMSGGHSCPGRINSNPIGEDKPRTLGFEADKNVCSTEIHLSPTFRLSRKIAHAPGRCAYGMR
jgi:hypothetical protein